MPQQTSYGRDGCHSSRTCRMLCAEVVQAALDCRRKHCISGLSDSFHPVLVRPLFRRAESLQQKTLARAELPLLR